MSARFDVIIVGSGFGGAVVACRLAERGMRVLVLERGRRWRPADYPRAPSDPWIWDERRPQRYNGWIDFRMFGRMSVAQGAGVGGGSLIFANVVVDPPREIFESGWPSEITFDELRPYYERVAEMLGVQALPPGQLTQRYRLMQEAARVAGHAARFRALPLAVTFDPEWHYDLQDPFNGHHSRTWTNAQGQLQGTCVHCGNCVIGCQVRAKNTLDLNYIPRAERHGAEVRPLHLVTAVAPEGNGRGYRVSYDRLVDGRREPGSETARLVVLAAGSLGSTELLLRCRDEFRTLPALSEFLGRNWSANGDFLTPATYGGRAVSPSQGPTITCAIDFLDGAADGERFFIEDGGFPNLLQTFADPAGARGRRTTLLGLTRASLSLRRSPRHSLAISRITPSLTAATRALGQLFGTGDPLGNVMPWLAQGVDAGDGRLYLGRRWFTPWRRRLKLAWDIRRSRAVMDAIVGMHCRLSKASGGRAHVPASWRLLTSLVTPHPLGGCGMSAARAHGVVDHSGAAFGYPGLYVADGAIVPRPLGLNPSKTIAALAERIAALMDA